MYTPKTGLKSAIFRKKLKLRVIGIVSAFCSMYLNTQTLEYSSEPVVDGSRNRIEQQKQTKGATKLSN